VIGFLGHIRRCNAWRPEDYRPWTIDGDIAGYVTHATAAELSAYSGLFVEEAGRLALHPRHGDRNARDAALGEAVDRLHGSGHVLHVTGERYPLRIGGRTVAALERGASAVLGIESSGCHVNGFVRRADGLYMWIGRRAPGKRSYPGQLDNFVAGGQPDGLSVIDNLVKECGEEAGVPPALARSAIPVGLVSYVMATEPGLGARGLNRHVLHCFDLELPADFQPEPVDGETAEFRLLPIREVAAIVEGSWDFKYNCALVIIDFLIRHGLLGPDRDDYLELCKNLRN
jgi:8-oxo-dGTP pyrophosphatase MutT (NUDIX family)